MNQDTTWLKAAQENFREAMDNKDWDMASVIMADTCDKGFEREAEDMQVELNGERAKGPTAVQGYILKFLRKKNEEYKANGVTPTLDLLIEDLTG